MELKVISQRNRSKFSSNNSRSSKEQPMGSRVVKQSGQEAGDAAQGALCWHIKHIHLLYIRLCLAQTMTENCWEFYVNLIPNEHWAETRKRTQSENTVKVALLLLL